MRAIYVLVAASLFSVAVPAEIYRSVGPDGSVVYTDRPARGAKKVDLPPLPTYTPREVIPEPVSQGGPKKAGSYYQALRILQPADEETIIDNNGVIDVSVLLEPALRANADHELQVLLDDREMKVSGMQARFSNVDRGTHRISARVLDHTGKTLIRSDEVRVHLRRPSRLMPARKNNNAN